MKASVDAEVLKGVVLPPKKSLSSGRLHEERVALLFVLAPILQFLVFAVGPMIYSLYISFQNWDGVSQMRYAGLSNYIEMFKDPYFYKSLYNTIYYLIGIPIGMVVSLLLAMAMNRKLPGTGVFRTIYYIPVISSLVAVSIIWGWIYNGDFGLANAFLGVFGIEGKTWIFEQTWVKPAIILMLIWRGMGTSIILYLAGLQNIPDEYYEAADIDGANGFQKLRHIILPLITPVSFFIVVTNIIGGLQLFTEIQIMTPAFPSPSAGGTEFSAATIVFYLFTQAFRVYKLGFASAVAWFLGILIFIVTIIQFKLSDRWVNTMN